MVQKVGGLLTLALVATLLFTGCTTIPNADPLWPVMSFSLTPIQGYPGWMYLDIRKKEPEEILIVEFHVVDDQTQEVVARSAELYEPNDWNYMRIMQKTASQSRFGFPADETRELTAFVTVEFRGSRRMYEVRHNPAAMPLETYGHTM